MSGKTLKFDNIEVNKKEFHNSKQAIDLNSVDIKKVTSDKFTPSDKGFKYFVLPTKMIISLEPYVLFCLK